MSKHSVTVSGRWRVLVIFFLMAALLLLAAARIRAEVTGISRVSVATGGMESNNHSFAASMSNDGRFFVFESYGTNLGPEGETLCVEESNCLDVFIHDRQHDFTQKMNISIDGIADKESWDPVISGDGRYVVYNSLASNIVPNDTNLKVDIFLYDVATGVNSRISTSHIGLQLFEDSADVTISGDGSGILFISRGRYVMPGLIPHPDGNLMFWQNRVTGARQLITRGYDGSMPNADSWGTGLSYDGRYVVFHSDASNLVPGDTNNTRDVFLHDRMTGKTTRISQNAAGTGGYDESRRPEISPEGRFIVFQSKAENLVPGDTNGVEDIFLYEIATGSLKLISTGYNGQANDRSMDPFTCADGRFVSYSSEASNILPGDTNGWRDAFFYDRLQDKTYIISANASGEWGDHKTHRPPLSRDCTMIAFASEASNLVPGDTNSSRDIFWSRIVWPADLSGSTQAAAVVTTSGSYLTYTVKLRNIGMLPASALFTALIPAQTSFVSADPGVSFGSGQVSWSGPVAAAGTVTFQYTLLVDAGITDPTLLLNQVTLTGDGMTHQWTDATWVNGYATFLPVMRR